MFLKVNQLLLSGFDPCEVFSKGADQARLLPIFERLVFKFFKDTQLVKKGKKNFN